MLNAWLDSARPARLARVAAAAVTTGVMVLTSWLLAAPAYAQKPLPAKNTELNASKPWTYLMAWALFAATALLIAATVIGYLIKGRQFRANQRRGGAK